MGPIRRCGVRTELGSYRFKQTALSDRIGLRPRSLLAPSRANGLTKLNCYVLRRETSSASGKGFLSRIENVDVKLVDDNFGIIDGSVSPEELLALAKKCPNRYLGNVEKAALEGDGLKRFSRAQLVQFAYTLAQRSDVISKGTVLSCLQVALPDEENFSVEELVTLSHAAALSCPGSQASLDLLGILEVRCPEDLSSLSSDGLLGLTASLTKHRRQFPSAERLLDKIRVLLQSRLNEFSPLSAVFVVGYLSEARMGTDELIKKAEELVQAPGVFRNVTDLELDKACRIMLQREQSSAVKIPVANELIARCARHESMSANHVCQVFHYAGLTGQVSQQITYYLLCWSQENCVVLSAYVLPEVTVFDVSYFGMPFKQLMCHYS